jgi:polyhydroxyalkanoate synthesis regulator phasin
MNERLDEISEHLGSIEKTNPQETNERLRKLEERMDRVENELRDAS